MSEEMKASSATGLNQDEILDRLEQMEKNLVEIAKQRRQRTVIVSCALLFILMAIGIFAYRMFVMVKEYDRKALAHELQTEFSRIASSAEANAIIKDFNTKALPVFREAIVSKLKEEAPSLRNEALVAADNVKKHLESSVREKVLEGLVSTLQKTERDILKRYQNLPLDEMDKVIKEAQNHFIEIVTANITQKVDAAAKELTSLHTSFEAFEDDPEYRALDPKLVGEVESKLIEALLDLCICHVNPKRGELPAASAK